MKQSECSEVRALRDKLKPLAVILLTVLLKALLHGPKDKNSVRLVFLGKSMAVPYPQGQYGQYQNQLPEYQNPTQRKPDRTIKLVIILIVVLCTVAFLGYFLTPVSAGVSGYTHTEYAIWSHFEVHVKNSGFLPQTKTVICYAKTSSGTYTNSEIVDLNPGEMKTIHIYVQIPYGESVSSASCGCNLF